jgi:hypothetical protein
MFGSPPTTSRSHAERCQSEGAVGKEGKSLRPSCSDSDPTAPAVGTEPCTATAGRSVSATRCADSAGPASPLLAPTRSLPAVISCLKLVWIREYECRREHRLEEMNRALLRKLSSRRSYFACPRATWPRTSRTRRGVRVGTPPATWIALAASPWPRCAGTGRSSPTRLTRREQEVDDILGRHNDDLQRE